MKKELFLEKFHHEAHEEHEEHEEIFNREYPIS